VGDLQISGAAMTVIVAMVGSLTGAVVYLFKSMQSAQDRRLQELRGDFQQAVKDLRTDYQARLDECRSENARLAAYIERQAATVKESTELLREINARIPLPGHV
jgi:methyl-accepting chemotaxis protein